MEQDRKMQQDLGLIIEPNLEDEDSGLNPYHCMMDRPHIIYNEKTKKFVCWMKIMHSSGGQDETVMTADTITGPYTLVREHLRPLGMSAGDFDLAVAEDGKAYYYFERVHSETICADLTEDYTDVTGYYSTHFPHSHPPYVREATAHFVRDHKHYLLTSGTSGYMPNPSEVAIADTWHGPYQVLGNPHVGDDSHTSFHSQISCIFKVQGRKDLYIACADRWCPDKLDVGYEVVEEFYRKAFGEQGISEEEKEKYIQIIGDDAHRDTSIAEYVWLPLRFEGDMVYIDWLDEWQW
jgi:hypothetical protein